MGKSMAMTTTADAANAVARSNTDDPLLALIERAARDPQIDLDKMERLFALHERAMQERRRAEYFAALSLLQSELPAAARRGTAHNDKKYARFEDIIEAMKPSLARYGFSLSFRVDNAGDRMKVTGILGHSSGHAEETHIYLAADATGNKNAVQAWGSATSYGKRYVTLALLAIATEDEDDDGQAASGNGPINAAGGNGPISEQQLTTLRAALDDAEADIPGFCRYFNIAALPDLPAAQFGRAMAAIAKKKRGKS